MKKTTLDELFKKIKKDTYIESYDDIIKLIESGKIRPIKNSGTNGKTPSLYTRYWVLEEKKDYTKLLDELRFKICTDIDITYYLKHPDIYETDRLWVLRLNSFLKNHKNDLKTQVSVNERCFEIWGREKFLSKEQGRRILSRCGIGEDKLNYYQTSEPIPYYVHKKSIPQNILIIENKDTFYTMRKHLLSGTDTILSMEFGTLVYGAGKGIIRSFTDFSMSVEPHVSDGRNTIYYFGDLDYEGLGIYEQLAGRFLEKRKIVPFIQGYRRMLEKAAGKEQEEIAMPRTRENQNKNLTGDFLSYFDSDIKEKITGLLRSGRYIPQEILNITDF